jgi:hypothetical protein
MASSESKNALLVQGWPQMSCDCVSRPRLASGESWLHLPPGVGLGRVVTASPARGWPWERHDCVSRPGVSCPGLAQAIVTASPAHVSRRASRDFSSSRAPMRPPPPPTSPNNTTLCEILENNTTLCDTVKFRTVEWHPLCATEGTSADTRDGNGYLKPEYPMDFTRFKCGYGMISLPTCMLMARTSTCWIDKYMFSLVLPITVYLWVKYNWKCIHPFCEFWWFG